MKFALSALSFLSLAFTAAAASSDHQDGVVPVDTQLRGNMNKQIIQHRDLQDTQTVVLGRTATVTVTLDQTTLNGLATFGDKLVAITPLVFAGDNAEVTCSASMAHPAVGTVDMRFFLRKALNPDRDQNGEANDFDCEASSDTDFISPDNESCSVTNFQAPGDLVFGYVAVIDNAFNMGVSYNIDFTCIETRESGGWCFSEDATVDVLGKGETTMSDLEVGDKVLNGDNEYEPVYAFAHLDKTSFANYFQIYTNDNDQKAPLEVTADHLVWANNKYIPAKEIQVGDALSNDATVTKITKTIKTGMYAPLTASGSLMVNGIKASSYVDLQNNIRSNGNGMIGNTIDTGLTYHFINHIALSPTRVICMGISSSLCNVDSIDEETGYAPFAKFWFWAIRTLFEGQSIVVQCFLTVLFFGIVTPFYIMESIFGATHAAPMMLLAMAGVFHYIRSARLAGGSGKVKQV